MDIAALFNRTLMNLARKFIIIPFFFLSACVSTSIIKSGPSNVGIVLCGAEFGENQLPGKLNTDYIYPNKDELTYFAAKGFNPITLPFKWERVQRTIGGELDTAEINRMKEFIVNCDSLHIKVILTLQNFAVYNINGTQYELNSRHLTNDNYKDFWKKMATTFQSYNNIYGYDIMNEPRGIFGRRWRKAAQSAIDGIREVDAIPFIIVDGENSSFSADWREENNKLRKLKDKADKIIYDAHCYFDYDHSGRYNNDYEGRITSNIGVERLKPFIRWLKKHHKKGMIGEFGVPADKKWMEVMDNFLSYATKNGVNVTYWAAGPWWNDYALSVEPTNGMDKPQMKILDKYLPAPKSNVASK